MIQSERAKIGETWLALASMYGKDVSRSALSMMLDTVDELPFESVLSVMRNWPKIPKNKSYPLPGDIFGIIKPEIDPDSEAIELTGRVLEAVRTGGLERSAEAEQKCGPVAWAVVKQYGWPYLIEHLGTPTLSLTTFQAQFRNAVKAHILVSKNATSGYVERTQIESKNQEPKRLENITRGAIRDLNDI